MSGPFASAIESKQNHSITMEHIAIFKRRAVFHLRVAFGILTLILLLFCAAGYVFIFAQDISQPVGSLDLYQQLEIALKNQADVAAASEIEFDIATEGIKTGVSNVIVWVSAATALLDAKSILRLLEEKKDC